MWHCLTHSQDWKPRGFNCNHTIFAENCELVLVMNVFSISLAMFTQLEESWLELTYILFLGTATINVTLQNCDFVELTADQVADMELVHKCTLTKWTKKVGVSNKVARKLVGPFC